MSDRERTPATQKRWAILVGACPIAAAALRRRMRYDAAVQDFMASPVGIVLILIVWVAFALGVRGWTRGHRERQVFLLSAAAGAALIMAVVAFANVYGWMGGMVVRAPLAIQMLVYGLHVLALVLLPLAAYRLAALRWPVGALLGYLGWVVVFSAISVPAENAFLAQGIVSYQNGYSMREDILWGAVMYLLALSIYGALAPRPGPLDGASRRQAQA